MKTIHLNNKTIKLYDCIDELPIINFQKYNKYLLIDAGLGSDANSIDTHIVNIAKYIQKNDRAKAIQELQNLRQSMHLIVSNVSPKYMAFAALIHSIDGKKLDDLSDDNLRSIIEKLNEVPHGFITSVLFDLKKKLSTDLETYFPSEFESAKEKEAYSKLKARTILQLQEIADEIDNAERIDEIDKALFDLKKPRNFAGKTSEEIKYDKQFESACMLISQKAGMNAKKMTTLEFYSVMDNISKQLEAERKVYNSHKKN